jgi:hypothetical protein
MEISLTSLIFLSLLIVFPCSNVHAEKELTEQQALDILAAQIQKDKLYDSWAPNLSCLLFFTEEKTKDHFNIAIREKHGGQCAGDPNTSPIVDRFRVDRLTGKIQWYDPVDGDLHPYEGVLKRVREK